jgi:hypothetical protein
MSNPSEKMLRRMAHFPKDAAEMRDVEIEEALESLLIATEELKRLRKEKDVTAVDVARTLINPQFPNRAKKAISNYTWLDVAITIAKKWYELRSL